MGLRLLGNPFRMMDKMLISNCWLTMKSVVKPSLYTFGGMAPTKGRDETQ